MGFLFIYIFSQKRPPDIQSGGHVVCVIAFSFSTQFQRITLRTPCQLLTSHRPNHIHQPPLLPPRLHGLTASRRREDTQHTRRTSTATFLATLHLRLIHPRVNEAQPSGPTSHIWQSYKAPNNIRTGTNLLLSISGFNKLSRGKIKKKTLVDKRGFLMCF